MQSPIVGTWTNELHSQLKIDSCGTDGRLTGVYRTAVGDVDHYKEFPLTGFWQHSTNVITFCVNWETSATCWIGHLAAEVITTSWTLQRSGEWNGKLMGTNIFKK